MKIYCCSTSLVNGNKIEFCTLSSAYILYYIILAWSFQEFLDEIQYLKSVQKYLSPNRVTGLISKLLHPIPPLRKRKRTSKRPSPNREKYRPQYIKKTKSTVRTVWIAPKLELLLGLALLFIRTM